MGMNPQDKRDMTISEFISRCDAYCAANGIRRATLSKKLLHDTRRLELLAAGAVDIGVNRLKRAISDLDALEAASSEKAVS